MSKSKHPFLRLYTQPESIHNPFDSLGPNPTDDEIDAYMDAVSADAPPLDHGEASKIAQVAVDRAKFVAAVQRELDSAPEDVCRIIEMYAEDMPVREIALQTSTAPNTVARTINTFISRVKRSLQRRNT